MEIRYHSVDMYRGLGKVKGKRKDSEKEAYRRVLDPSENVTPNTRFGHPMGIEASFRRLEIPLEGQVGYSHIQYIKSTIHKQ